MITKLSPIASTKGRRTRRVPRRASINASRMLSSGGCLQTIVEETVDTISTSAGGLITGTIYQIRPVDLILASRLSGLQALHDEVRIDRVRLELVPQLGMNTVSTTAMYIERDPSAAVVGSIELAASQFEVVMGPLNKSLVITWRPQQPSDREFHRLNPGTVSLGSIFVLGGSAGVTASVPAYLARVTLFATVRGRP